MVGMKGMALAGGVGAVACLVLAFLWKSEQASHESTKRMLDAETRRADVATEAANSNAAKAAELEKDMALNAERQKIREAENARILKARNDELTKMRNRIGAWKDALENRPEVAARVMRAELNRRLRELATITCRTGCEDRDDRETDKPAPPS